MPIASIGTNLHRPVLSQTESIEQEHPGYLHYLFWDVITKKGNNSGFEELASQMVLIGTSTSDARPSIDISTYQLRTWFYGNNGIEISSKEKPLDSENHCVLRKDWVIDQYGLLTCLFTPVVYLDEKWFY